jgi:hypothetical protein
LQTLRLIPAELTNEYRLLLVCARKDLTAQQLEAANSAISSGVDWDLLTRLAEEHGLSPLLYWHLQRSFPTQVPNGQRQHLKVFENNRRNLSLSAALLRLLDALQDAGIRALAYKGPALATLLYGDVTLRQMSDLDILIDGASFHAAREVVMGLGYQPAFVHSRKQEEARLRSDCECEFSDAGGKLMVDLHWQITASHLAQRFCFDEFWQRRRIVTIGPGSVPTFSAGDTALVLAVHGGKHLWQRLGWLADFAESLRHDLDWQTLRMKAHNARAERMLLLALALAKDIVQVEIPAELTAAIKDDTAVQALAATIAKNLFGEQNLADENKKREKDQNDAEGNPVRWLTMLQLADSRWDGMRSAVHFALSSGPREWQAVRLPDSLFGLYHVVRIATLLRNVPSFFSRGRASRSSR